MFGAGDVWYKNTSNRFTMSNERYVLKTIVLLTNDAWNTRQ